MTKKLSMEDLQRFTGTTAYYHYPFAPDVKFTDGARYVAETAGAHWLLADIMFAQDNSKKLAAETFQLWALKVSPDQSAVLQSFGRDGTLLYERPYDHTSFPLPLIRLYFQNNVIFLPSEY